MEKITAVFLFLTLIGALLVIASANESDVTTKGITRTDPKTALVTSDPSKVSPNSFTTPAKAPEASASESNVTTGEASSKISPNNFTTLAKTPEGNASTNVTSATPKTNQTNDVLITTPNPVSDVTTKTNQTKGVNTTTPMSVSKSTPKTNQTKGDKQTPGPKKPPTESPTTPPKVKTTQTTPNKHKNGSSASITYIIIILVIILCITGAIGFCCYQNKSRTFSLDRSSKSEDAHIPLSTVEPEVFEASASKDMETFTATETSGTVESSPPAEAVEKKEEEKAPAAEAPQPEKESSAESQATVPLVEKPEELTVVDLNDEEQAISNKTSMETLEETPNENNSNNRAQARVKNADGNFIEINLDDLL
ncbi:putative uncharacterized protein DDB_G0290521 isoform X2 [Astyanax mexicanus]|uniref:putative uncharacterized protein DDB_G0290521 isoform X2 n=1 Tax=Astyanax mexicanus TaxID=7994 RepID=UPI0020CAD452|nr:putative uncharacterized protein DDB_G0290521 isoform X2 [Astyanax mexicanus]